MTKLINPKTALLVLFIGMALLGPDYHVSSQPSIDGSFGGSFLVGISNGILNFFQMLASTFINMIKSGTESVQSGVAGLGAVLNVLSSFSQLLVQTANSLNDAGKLTTSQLSTLLQILNQIVKVYTSIISQLSSVSSTAGVSDLLNSAQSQLQSLAQQIQDLISKLPNQILSSLTGVLNNLLSSLNGLSGLLPGVSIPTLPTIPGIVLPTLPGINIPSIPTIPPIGIQNPIPNIPGIPIFG